MGLQFTFPGTYASICSLLTIMHETPAVVESILDYCMINGQKYNYHELQEILWKPFWIYQVGNMRTLVMYFHKLHIGMMWAVLAVFGKKLFERPSLYNLLAVPSVWYHLEDNFSRWC